jgi:hypothetical protein
MTDHGLLTSASLQRILEFQVLLLPFGHFPNFFLGWRIESSLLLGVFQCLLSFAIQALLLHVERFPLLIVSLRTNGFVFGNSVFSE